MLAVITTVFLANTVDYGDLKNNRRDESVIFSMQTFVVKLASGVSALIASLALQILALSNETEEGAGLVDYSAGVDGMQKMGLRMTMTIIPIIGIVFAIFWFRKKYILTDEKLQEISVELVKRKTIETEEQSAN
jgi:melibiose permease